MATRKDFLKDMGLMMGALAISGPSFSFANFIDEGYLPGLQLYTIRDFMIDDPIKSLERVANMGYRVLEHATYSGSLEFYGMSVKDMNDVLNKNGLKMVSGHYGLGEGETEGTILKGWKKAVDDAAEIGIEFMVCPFLLDGQRKNLDDYRKRAEDFNKAGEICKEAGIQFCYHNHNFEFEEIDGQIPYDVLLRETDNDLVKMEMDMFWINRAGYNPLHLFNKYPRRFPLWHLKDMAIVGDNGTTDLEKGAAAITEVGNGTINWPSLFARGNRAGLKYFFVEQDITPGDPYSSIRNSLIYLKNNIL